VSTIGSSGTQRYSWKTFIITALCLLITLPLSLGIGGVLRLAYRGTTYYATYWRIFAIFPSVAFIFFSIFGWFLPFSRIALYLLDLQWSSASFLVCEGVSSMGGQAKATFLECNVGCHVRIILVELLHAGRSNDAFPPAMPLLRLVPTVVEEKATGEG
jgi:hypothetical protein